MSISNTGLKDVFTVDATTGFTHTFTFDVEEASQVKVLLYDDDGDEDSTVWTRVTNSSPDADEYYVDVDNSQVKIGGSGTLRGQYGSDIAQLVVYRDTPLVQSLALPSVTALNTESLESTLDRLVMMIQEQNDILKRCFVGPVSDEISDQIELPNAAARANKFLGFDASGNPVAAVASTTALTVSNYVENNILSIASAAAFRTQLNVPAESEIIKTDGSNDFTADQSMGSNKLTNVTDPTAAQDAATKNYADGLLDDNYVKVTYTRASGDAGQAFTKDDWRTCIVNTEDNDADGICSIAANQITLDAGTYDCIIKVPAKAGAGGKCKLRLYNKTDSDTLILGINTPVYYMAALPVLSGRFTIAASKALEIQVYPTTTDLTAAEAISSGESEVYTHAEFWKVA